VKFRHLLLHIAFHFISTQFSASLLGLGVHILLHVTSCSHIDLVKTNITTQAPSSRRVESHSVFTISSLNVKTLTTGFFPPQLFIRNFNPLPFHLSYVPFSYTYTSCEFSLQSSHCTLWGLHHWLISTVPPYPDWDHTPYPTSALGYLFFFSRTLTSTLPASKFNHKQFFSTYHHTPRASVTLLSTYPVILQGLNHLSNTVRESSLLHRDHLPPPRTSGRQSERRASFSSVSQSEQYLLALTQFSNPISLSLFRRFRFHIPFHEAHSQTPLAIHFYSLILSFDNTSLFAERFPIKVLLHDQERVSCYQIALLTNSTELTKWEFCLDLFVLPDLQAWTDSLPLTFPPFPLIFSPFPFCISSQTYIL
jgi:hypothetical protein